MSGVGKRPRYSSTPPYTQVVQTRRRGWRRGALAFRSKSKKRAIPDGVKFMNLPFWQFGPTQSRTFPARLKTNLVYNINSYMSCDNSQLAQLFYRLNSPYDPDAAVGGNQPYYFDTLCGANGTGAPYAKFRVLWTKFHVEFYNQFSTQAAMQVGAGVALDLNSVASSAAGMQLLCERGGFKVLPLLPAYSTGNQCGLHGFVSHKDMLGVKDIKDADDQIGTYATNPPGSIIHLMIFAGPLDWADTTIRQVYFRLRIEFEVEFFDLNTSSES